MKINCAVTNMKGAIRNFSASGDVGSNQQPDGGPENKGTLDGGEGSNSTASG
jgi:hypothetical protein